MIYRTTGMFLIDPGFKIIMEIQYFISPKISRKMVPPCGVWYWLARNTPDTSSSQNLRVIDFHLWKDFSLLTLCTLSFENIWLS